MERELKKILFVDDDPDIHIIVKLCLESIPHLEFCSAFSGAEALKVVEKFQPDLILLDVMMPQMDGIATLDAIRKLPGLSKIAVIFVTAKAQAPEVASYAQYGLAGVVLKPFDPHSLDRTILQMWKKWEEAQGNR